MTSRRARLVADGVHQSEAFRLAADEAVAEQVKNVAIPRRFTTIAREIWFFQPRLAKRTRKHAERLVEHARFRAAYDFLLLRVEAGEPLAELGDWWTKFQQVEGTAREEMLADLSVPSRNRRRPRTRRKSPID